MANQKILDKKQNIIDEIVENVKSSASIVWFDNNGLSVAEQTELRRNLRENDCELKVYKNTLTTRAAGIVDGNIADLELLNKLASVPSRDTLLTMLAGALLGTVRDLSIALDLYSEKLEK